MIVYHISRNTVFEPGQKIELIKNPVLDGTYGNELLRLFPNGVSQHGLKYLQNYEFYSFHVDFLESLEEINSWTDSIHIEYTFELVRQILFPQNFSRLTSFFALESLEDLRYWSELKESQYHIFELNINQPPQKFDASFLNSGLSFDFNETQFVKRISPAKNFSFAKHYWSGKSSESPKPELLIDLQTTTVEVLGEV